MKAIFIGLAIGLGGVIGGGWVAVKRQDANAQLRVVNRQLESDLRVAQATVDALQTEKATVQQQLAQVQEEARTVQTRTTETEAANSKDAALPAPPVVKPYQVSAYMGQAQLGQVWIVPRNLRYDTNAQRYAYEPIVVLDEKFRNRFTVYQTNIVEREVATTYVDNNNYYYPQPIYYGGGGHHHGTNRPPTNPGPNPQPSPQPVPQPPKFVQPSSTVTPQKLLIDAKDIKTIQN